VLANASCAGRAQTGWHGVNAESGENSGTSYRGLPTTAQFAPEIRAEDLSPGDGVYVVIKLTIVHRSFPPTANGGKRQGRLRKTTPASGLRGNHYGPPAICFVRIAARVASSHHTTSAGRTTLGSAAGSGRSFAKA